jgi:hypothetical protein
MFNLAAFFMIALKLALAACLAHDGDLIGAAVVAILSPSIFLLRDTRKPSNMSWNIS